MNRFDPEASHRSSGGRAMKGAWLFRHEFADEAWGKDARERLEAYDPLVNEVVNIAFEPNDRVVITYRCEGKSQGRRTFVIPKWTPPS